MSTLSSENKALNTTFYEVKIYPGRKKKKNGREGDALTIKDKQEKEM